MGFTAADVPEQSGRRVVITGANSGIGRETTRELARRGASVVMACRNRERATRAADRIRSDVRDPDLRIEELDLASLASVRAFADRLEGRFDALINNAGVMALPRRETEDGFEMQFGVNHLGHFALTGLLVDRIESNDDRIPARVVTVSSGAHRMGTIEFDDLHGREEYGRWSAYAQSKLANVLFAYELARRLSADGRDVESVAAHPGYADTNLQRKGPNMEGSRLKLAAMDLANRLFGQSPAMGALPTLYAATSPEAEGGCYYGPGGLFDMRGSPERQSSSDRSHDRETARRLWKRSREETGVEYPLATSEVE